jgi:hypothetical protein
MGVALRVRAGHLLEGEVVGAPAQFGVFAQFR